ncbi:MAG TPA: acetyl-CoA carboxylase biotin carboxyl carrier protein subunit [Paenirhodobacter sp.]
MKRTPVLSELSGTIWEISVATGDVVEEGQELLLLESMKMEIPCIAPVSGTVVEIAVAKGDAVTADQPLIWIA